MNSTPMDCLPPEMICKILKNLNLDELTNCKLVCKQWYSIICQSVKLTKLVVIEEYDFNKFWRRRWYHSNELINQDLEYCKLYSFLTHFKQNYLSNLKQLRIDGVGLPDSFDWNQLNLFTKLIHLEIRLKISDKPEEKFNLNLNLSDLELLEFHCWNSNRHFSIECPKLKVLNYRGYGNQVNLNIKYPESVKDLQTDFTGEKLAQFKNVEYLKFNYYNFVSILNETTIKNLRNLKEITCIDSISNIIDMNFDGTLQAGAKINEMKSILRDFLKSAKELKMSDLKLKVAGLQVTEQNIDLIDFGLTEKDGYQDIDDTHFYAVNYKHLQDYLPFIDEVDYNQLLESIGQIPKDFFTKFFAIERVTATGLIDQEHFLWFLKNLESLTHLQLERTNLTQSFFDELPTFCSLVIFKLIDDKDLELNFGFVAKFIKLKYLKIKKSLNLKSATSLIRSFRNLKYLEDDKLSFYLKNEKYFIQRRPEDSNRYDVVVDLEVRVRYDVVVSGRGKNRTLRKNINLDQIVEYFEELE